MRVIFEKETDFAASRWLHSLGILFQLMECDEGCDEELTI